MQKKVSTLYFQRMINKVLPVEKFLFRFSARFFFFFFLLPIQYKMVLINYKTRNYILYVLSCAVILTASITLIVILYRLQRDTSLLDRERKRDYVSNKINKSFPILAIIISIIICLSALLSFIAMLINGRTEILILSIVSNIILGIGSIILSVIKLGFVQNIVENFPVDIERLLVDFIINNSKCQICK